VKYTIINATFTVTYRISYTIYKIVTLIPLYSGIKIKLVAVNYMDY